MSDAAVVGRILREYHQRRIRPSDVKHVHGSVRGDQIAYRLRQLDGESVVVRASRADAAVGPQFSGCGAATMVDWLSSRAATLVWLGERGYPAPRVVPTRSGDLVGVAGPWLTLATTFVPGSALRPDRGELVMLGEALGRLHSLPAVAVNGPAGEVDGSAGGPEGGRADGLVDVGAGLAVGKSYWDLGGAIPATLGRLRSC